jgi:RNA polymerase sigma-70 factor (ECF subfamily)
MSETDRTRRIDPGVLSDDARRRFEAVALPHLEYLYRLAVRLKGSAQDAEDLVQETYAKALRAFPSLRDLGAVRGWLRQILTRLVVDHHRTEPREIAVGDLETLDRFSLYDRVWDEDPFPYSDHLHRDFLAQFDDEAVRQALCALPAAYRVPLVLLYVEDLTYKELAEMLECPIGTIMSRLHRGRKILERELWDCARRRGLVKEWEG